MKVFPFVVGTYKLKDEKVLQEVLDAGLKCGYRLVGQCYFSRSVLFHFHMLHS